MDYFNFEIEFLNDMRCDIWFQFGYKDNSKLKMMTQNQITKITLSKFLNIVK